MIHASRTCCTVSAFRASFPGTADRGRAAKARSACRRVQRTPYASCCYHAHDDSHAGTARQIAIKVPSVSGSSDATTKRPVHDRAAAGSRGHSTLINSDKCHRSGIKPRFLDIHGRRQPCFYDGAAQMRLMSAGVSQAKKQTKQEYPLSEVRLTRRGLRLNPILDRVQMSVSMSDARSHRCVKREGHHMKSRVLTTQVWMYHSLTRSYS